MIEVLWILPALALIALVLGSCRGETVGRILRESARSFVKLVVGMVLLAVAVQLVLRVVPVFY
jgi:hypothetical protein